MRPFRWRDSAFTFALGLSLLTVLVIPHWNWLVLERHRSYTLELSGTLSKAGFLLLGSAVVFCRFSKSPERVVMACW